MKRPKVSKGYYSRPEVEDSGLPFWTGSKWIGADKFKDMCVILTKSRAKRFGTPIKDDENPIAFRYCVKGPGTYKYTALYDRTAEMIARGVHDTKFYIYEFIAMDEIKAYGNDCPNVHQCNAMKTFEVIIPAHFFGRELSRFITAKSAGEAKYNYWLKMSDAYGDMNFGNFVKQVKCRRA
jgi:hypothetical protein